MDNIDENSIMTDSPVSDSDDQILGSGIFIVCFLLYFRIYEILIPEL